jgi:hypothetical protein
VWNDTSQHAIENPTLDLVSTPTLSRFFSNILLQTDAIFCGLGATLAQEVESSERVIAYASQTLLEAENEFSVAEGITSQFLDNPK